MSFPFVWFHHNGEKFKDAKAFYESMVGWMLDARGRNRAARAEELRRVYPRVLAKLLGVTRSLPDAEDALQDAVLRALGSWTDTEAPESAEAWLLTVATNAHRDRFLVQTTEDRSS